MLRKTNGLKIVFDNHKRLKLSVPWPGGIAHDFNNILAAIMGYSEIALGDLSDQSPAKNSLENILKSSLRARDLVKQILAFSRKGAENKDILQVNLIVKEALKMLRASLPATIDIQQDISTDKKVLADPT